MEVIQRVGPMTRADLVRDTGISPPTMSKLISGLLRERLVEEDPQRAMTSGRPGIRFRLAVKNAQILSAVLDVDRCTLGSCGLDGVFDPARIRSFDTPKTRKALMDRLASELASIRADRGVPCMGLGVTVAGLLDRDQERVVFSPNMHFLDGNCPGVELGELLDVESHTMQEDQAMCAAERMFGGAKGLSDFAVVDATAGLGAGVFVDGKPLSGCHGYGGEIGHTTIDPNGPPCGCGNRGCLELYATDAALVRAVASQRNKTASIDELLELSRKGTFRPGRTLDPVVRHLAICVSAIVNIFNPEAVFVHCKMLDFGPEVLTRLREMVAVHALGPSCASCRVERTKINKLLGAAASIIQHLHGRLGPSLGGR
jgi:predicted NBD/HSP70 family sugar kinase